ncbi:MAG: bifunctional UDP-N-acetylglucosamine diphosphorylase/glucosamine-1-phosphate N-acetyltransferase GlmU [Bacillota bacterium]
MNQLWAVVLAAGEGKRMYSKLPKVLHSICGRSMLDYITGSAAELTDNILIVIGYGASLVREQFKSKYSFILQEQQLGTGHAVLESLAGLPDEGTLLILCGDTPLLTSEHLDSLIKEHHGNAVTVATTILPDPSGYGWIIRDASRRVKCITEDRDASEQEKEINEINTGTYCFDLRLLREYLPRLSTENAQQEYYLTDVVSLLYRDGYKAGSYIIDDYRVGLGINNRVQLAEAAMLMREKINKDLMMQGVTMIDPANTYIEHDVSIGTDTTLLPNTTLEKGTVIGRGCLIGPNSHLSRVKIEDGVVIRQSYLEGVTVEAGKTIGPFECLISVNSENC